MTASAIVTVYDVDSIAPYSTVVPVGAPPFQPVTATVRYTDGVTQSAAVTWAPVDPSQYASAGQFSVEGTVAGTSARARADVRVTASFTPGQKDRACGQPDDAQC